MPKGTLVRSTELKRSMRCPESITGIAVELRVLQAAEDGGNHPNCQAWSDSGRGDSG